MFVIFVWGMPCSYISNILVFQLIVYAGYAVLAFLSSFVISIAFEAPVCRLLKIINTGGPKKNQ